MNAKILILALAGALPLAAPASPPEPATILIDCAHPALPSQRQFAQLTGYDNFGKVYHARTRLMVNTQRLCQRRMDAVQLVLAPPTRDTLPAQWRVVAVANRR